MMNKKTYYAPEACVETMLASNLICDSYTGGIDDYELIENYEWQD